MIQITGEVRAEAARGTGYTYMLRLVQLPAYGKRTRENNWRKTLTCFKRGMFAKVRPAKCKRP